MTATDQDFPVAAVSAAVANENSKEGSRSSETPRNTARDDARENGRKGRRQSRKGEGDTQKERSRRRSTRRGEDAEMDSSRSRKAATSSGRTRRPRRTRPGYTADEPIQADIAAESSMTASVPEELQDNSQQSQTPDWSIWDDAPLGLSSESAASAASVSANEEAQPEAPLPRERSRMKGRPEKDVEPMDDTQSEPMPVEESSSWTEEASDAPRDDADAAGEDGEDSPMRKRKRRGRRGGRGRGRRNQTQVPSEEESSEGPATARLPDGVVTMVAAGGQPVTTVEDELEEEEESTLPTGRRRMYISIMSGEQVEVALTNNGVLEEYYLDMLHQKKIKGNIYRGIIHNIDPNLQAAFVDFGEEKNGFLQIDEIHPEYYVSNNEPPSKGKKFPPIQKVLRMGQEVLVQVVKEPTGNKGAFLTTWISLAGRFLVLTPGQEQIGISRKVDDEGERARLRELMAGIDPGEDLGVIVRTVSAGVTRQTLKNDLTYLKRTWSDVRRRATEVNAPACVYKEPSLPERAVRDYLTDDVCELWVDDPGIARGISDTVALLFPRKKELVRQHTDTRHSMWERFGLRRQLDQIYSREVLMPSGGRLVFDQTEALMAIDVNSGKISGKGNFEAMAFRTNMEAAETIARQLKLRDIGGQVVIDFIEMKEHKHVIEVERMLRTSMRHDRARHDFARMSAFGLLELVRQRTGNSAISISMEPCPHCGGTGLRRNLEWQSLQAIREISMHLRFRSTLPYQYQTTQELGLYLLNHKRDALRELETRYGRAVEIVLKA